MFDSLFAREKLGSTGLGQGIAIPHGRIKGLKDALGAFVRPRQPIPFDAPDGKPVSLVFVLLVPEQATEKHLQILSELAADVQRARIPRPAVDGDGPGQPVPAVLQLGARVMSEGGAMRQISIEKLFEDNRSGWGSPGSPAGRAAAACSTASRG